MKQAPGKGLLKVTGILFIIFGAVSVVVTLIGVFMGTFFVAAGMSVTGAVVVVGIIIMCLGGLLEFLAGIFGVKNCDKPEKCNTCIVYGEMCIRDRLFPRLSCRPSGGRCMMNQYIRNWIILHPWQRRGAQKIPRRFAEREQTAFSVKPETRGGLWVE